MTVTLHRCSNCNHSDENHARGDVGDSCCMGWCPCRRLADQLVEAEPATQIPTWPGFDAATGRWAER